MTEYLVNWVSDGNRYEEVAIVVAKNVQEVGELLCLSEKELLSTVVKFTRVGKGAARIVCQGVL